VTTIEMFYNGNMVVNYVINDPTMAIYDYFVTQALEQCVAI